MESQQVSVVYDNENTKRFETSDENVGYDLRCNVEEIVVPMGGASVIVSTGVSIAMPQTMWANVRERSGLACKGITVRGGVIDSGYRGKLCVIMANFGDSDMTFRFNDRIAQLVFMSRVPVTLNEVEVLESSERSTNGLGSSGLQ